MKVTIAQMDVIPGRPDLNVAKMLEKISAAKNENSDVICFSELCISGYLLGDKWTDADYCRNLMSYNKVIQEASKSITVIYGNVYIDDLANLDHNKITRHHPNRDGRVRKYNAVYVYTDGKPAERVLSFNSCLLPEGISVKTLHPTYRVFDDDRYFTSLIHLALDYGVPVESLLTPFAIKTKDGKTVNIGCELCEDQWSKDYLYHGKPLNVTKFLIQNGADYIFNLSASPWTYGKNRARDNRIAEI